MMPLTHSTHGKYSNLILNSKVIDLTVKGQLKELAKHLDSVLDI